MTFYRYKDVLTSSGTMVYLYEYSLVKETPCGYWISFHFGLSENQRWISKKSRKKFAYPSKAEALNSFGRRKYRQIKILENQLSRAKAAYANYERMVREN